MWWRALGEVTKGDVVAREEAVAEVETRVAALGAAARDRACAARLKDGAERLRKSEPSPSVPAL